MTLKTYSEEYTPMTFEEYKDKRDSAVELRSRGSFTQAGHLYTAAAHEILGRANYAEEPLEKSQVDTARGLSAFMSAALCYRLAGENDRCWIRCSQGILIAEEIRDHVANYEPQQGMMYEYIGDFRVIGGREDWKAAYEAAEAIYAEVDNVIGWIAEPEIDINTTFMVKVAKSVDYEIDRHTKAEIDSCSLDRRIQYKQANFKEIIDRVIEEGEWS